MLSLAQGWHWWCKLFQEKHCERGRCSRNIINLSAYCVCFCRPSSFISGKTLERALVYNTRLPGKTCRKERQCYHSKNLCTRNTITAIDSKFKNEMRKERSIRGGSEQKMWEEKLRFIRMSYNIQCTFFLPHSGKLSTNGAIGQSPQKHWNAVWNYWT